LKIYFQLAAIGSAFALSAYGDTSPTNSAGSTPAVILASPSHTFEIGVTALYLQPTGSNLKYAAEAFPYPAPSPHWHIHGIDTDYHWGFDLAIKGILQGTHTYLAMNWEHLHTSDSDSRQTAAIDMIGPFFEIGPDATPYTKAYGQAAFHFDEANANYGIFIHLGDRLKTSLFSGLSYVHIKETLSSQFSNVEGTIIRKIKLPITFTGGGPQIGTDFAYCIGKGFNFTGKAKASFLIGVQKNHTTYTAISPAIEATGVSSPNIQSTDVTNKIGVIPGLGASLGFSYVHTYGNNCMIKLETGYQVQTYLNALESVNIGSEVITPPVTPDTVGVYARTFETNQSNMALAGPYFTLVLGF